MREPLFGDLPSNETYSWLTRVLENARQLLTRSGLSPLPANGAPLHLLKLDRTGERGHAQAASLLTHIGVIVGMVCFVIQPRVGKHLREPIAGIERSGLVFRPPVDTFVSKASLGSSGGGGENNPAPATRGFLAPRSSIQLAAPRLPDGATHELPVPVTILDAQAPPALTPVPELGLPWMLNDTDSAGPGKNHGIGSGANGGMGEREGRDAGNGLGNGPYASRVSMPVCIVCPLPIYSDEARHVKVQGTVTLRVLVGADGKASEIRVVKGVGYGLEERAVETVREWKFRPAYDAARRATPAWVTIEAVFRLF